MEGGKGKAENGQWERVTITRAAPRLAVFLSTGEAVGAKERRSPPLRLDSIGRAWGGRKERESGPALSDKDRKKETRKDPRDASNRRSCLGLVSVLSACMSPSIIAFSSFPLSFAPPSSLLSSLHLCLASLLSLLSSLFSSSRPPIPIPALPPSFLPIRKHPNPHRHSSG